MHRHGRSFVLLAAVVLLSSAPAIRATASTGVAFNAPITLAGPGFAPTTAHAWVVDATGDGVADVVEQAGASAWVWPYANGSFTTTATEIPLLPTGTYIPWFAAGDLNGDGKTDLIYSDGASIDVRLQQNAGAFAAATTAFGEGSGAHAVGDVDGDGADELIVEHWTGNDLTLEQVDRVSSSWTATDLGIPGTSSDQIMLSDLNGDGRIDVVASSGNFANTRAALRQQDGTYATAVQSDIWGITVADLSADAIPDLATAAGYYPGNGAGGFGAYVPIVPWGSHATYADVNGDGLDDLYLPGSSDRVVLQTATGTWASTCTLLQQSTGAYLLGADDITGDGRPELFVQDGYPNYGIRVYPGSAVGGAAVNITYDPTPTIAFGESYTLSGTVQPDRICPATSLAGADLELWRSDDGGPMAQVASGTVAPDATFSLSDLPPNAGHYDYEVRYAGDATHASVSSSTVPLDVAATGGLSLRFSGPRYAYGQDAPFTVKVKPFDVTTNLSVDLYRKRAGGTMTYWETVQVSPSSGVYQGVIPNIDIHTTIKAAWAGDTVWPPQSVTDEAAVHVVFKGRFLKAAGKQGDYTLFREGKTVYFATVVSPAIVANERFEVQHERYGSWYRKLTGTFKPNRDGVLVVGIPAQYLQKGERYRIRASHPGTTGIDGWLLKWQDFRII